MAEKGLPSGEAEKCFDELFVMMKITRKEGMQNISAGLAEIY